MTKHYYSVSDTYRARIRQALGTLLQEARYAADKNDREELERVYESLRLLSEREPYVNDDERTAEIGKIYRDVCGEDGKKP